MSWEQQADFAEGDSGVYQPGHGLRMWQEICAAKAAAALNPAKLIAKSAGQVQAEVMAIATDPTVAAGDRVAAYRLCFDMAKFMADAEMDPLAPANPPRDKPRIAP